MTSSAQKDLPLTHGAESLDTAFSTDAMSNALPDFPASAQQPWLTIFSQNVAAPVFSTTLPPPRARFENTTQLAYCNYLLRKCLSPSLAVGAINTPLEPTLQALIEPYAQNEDEAARVRWLAHRVVEEFVTDSLKDCVVLSEVLLLAPSLDQEHYRKLLNCLISEFEAAKLLDIDLLQGLVQLVETASSDYLQPDDLIRILSVLRARLQDTHQQTVTHLYYLVQALSRVLDVMVEGKVKDLKRVVDHEPLSALLDQLKDGTDPYLKHRAIYASQGLLHVPNDETRRQSMLRHAGNITMGLLGVMSVCKLDLGQLKDGTEHLYKVAGEAHEVGNKIVDGAQSLRESSQDIWPSFKGGVLASGRLLWYSALREAQEHVRNGRLQDFNRLVLKAPCRNQIEFQWGISQLLGEIASDDIWDTIVRQQAADFLGELYKKDAEWSQDENVKTWMLSIITQLSKSTDQAIATHALALLKDLQQEQDITANLPFPLRNRLATPSSYPLFTRVLAIPDVEYDLQRLRMRRLADHRSGVYIPPQAKPSLQATDDTLFPLMEKVKEFLAGSRQVFLVLGDSGAGKSTFNLELEHTLWNDYKKYGPIPLYINLPTIDNPAQDMIRKQLLKYNFSEDQIGEMKLHRQFILICDGYDESQLKVNLHTTNQFNQDGQWLTKVVISCRSQYLGQDYRSRFQPKPVDRYQRITVDLFQEAVIAAFSRAQIQQYVEQYIKGFPAVDDLQGRPSWTKEEYMDKLTWIPNLMDLVSNPFLLTLALEALPTFVTSKRDLSSIKITRVQLYDSFVKRWLETNRERLERSALSDNERSELDLLTEDNFLFHGTMYQQNLATQIYIRHARNPVVQYTHLRDRDTWKATFFSPDGQAKLIRESSTVTRSGAYFQFLHRSLLEYFYSRTIYDPKDYTDDDGSSSPERSSTAKTGLLSMALVGEPSILQFLAERVQADTAFKADLFGVIEDSKTDAEVAQAASNAISILVKAKVPMNSLDFRGIRIPGADLRGGQFDSSNFEGADLRGVNLEKTWLRQANLRRTQLKDVQFGELQYLKVNGRVWATAFSADGRFLAVTTRNLEVTIFDTTNWASVGKAPSGLGLAFSPAGYEVAIGVKASEAVQLLNILTGQVRLVLRGHQHVVVWITYSPDGTRLATGCIDATDKTVRTWDVERGESLAVLEEHAGPVKSVAYSPDGYQIASGSEDKTVRLWDVHTGEAIHSLVGHMGPVLSVAYSPDGRQVASGGDDMALRLWDPHSGDLYDTLSGHSFKDVCGVAYAPTSNYIASGDDGGYIRLWKAGTTLKFATPRQKVTLFTSFSAYGRWMTKRYSDNTVRILETLTGVSLVVSMQLAASPFQRLFASSSGSIVAAIHSRFTVRIWNVEGETGQVVHVLKGHTGTVKNLAFSYDDRLLVSASVDRTLRVWDTVTGEAVCVLEGLNESVNSITFSPSGHQVAACDEGMVQVWSAETGERLFALDNNAGIGRFGYSLDGQYIISSAHSGHNCWDTESGERSNRFAAIDTEFFTFTFSPNGRFLATTGRDGLLRLWHVGDEDCRAVYQTKLEITYMIFWKEHQDNQYLVTMNSSMSTLVYRLFVPGGKTTTRTGSSSSSYRLELVSTREGPGVLFLESVVMDDAEGLNISNLKLLQQRGATGSGALRLKVRKLDDGTYEVIE
ncbi:hypothetical protein BGZ89_010107 [Linnemannia elongata]|nr:hypothetical protein BGZ89_010107 [Linnemannia elongata]